MAYDGLVLEGCCLGKLNSEICRVRRMNTEGFGGKEGDLDGADVSAWTNVYLLPAYHRMPLVQDWTGEATLRIDNFGCIVQAYGPAISRQVQSAVLQRVHRAVGSYGVATPDGDGNIDMLLWDAAAIGGNPEPVKAAAWLTDLVLQLTLEPVVTESGPVHAIIGSAPKKGFGSSVSFQSGSVSMSANELGGNLREDEGRSYRSDMAAASQLLQALGGSRQRGPSDCCAEVGVLWQPIAATSQPFGRPMFEASLGLININGQLAGIDGAIAAAERLGVVHLVDRYLVGQVTAELRGAPTSLSLLVPLSAASLCSGEILAELELSPAAASRLVLELRDSSEQVDWGQAVDVISRLRRVGSKISIGSFGTGFASLRHLLALRPDFITVDPRLLAAAGLLNAGEETLVHLVGLARSLGADVILDHVDSEDASLCAGSLGAAFKKGAWIGPPRLCRPWATGCTH